MAQKARQVRHWAGMFGRWNFDDAAARYLGPAQTPAPAPFGLAITEGTAKNVDYFGKITLVDTRNGSGGRLAFGFNPLTGGYLSAGIGGYECSYVLDEFVAGRGWMAHRVAGAPENIQSGTSYDVRVRVEGQRVRLDVNQVTVLEHEIPHPLYGERVGLFAWGQTEVGFSDLQIRASLPKAFVVMQFSEPYNSLHKAVIRPVCKEVGLEVKRADDIFRPGVILNDIVQLIVESEIVIAEITPINGNVYYELGYAHAMRKPTILLAERGAALPFDIRGHRVVFYDNTIKGKGRVEEDLRRHLRGILGMDAGAA